MAAADRHFPCSYVRLISSEAFTLRAGPLLKPFSVHKQLLANLSLELRGHVFNGMREGHEESMDMMHVSEETMGQFLEFCYTGDYSQLVNEAGGEPYPPSQQLLPNTELYILGDMYNIQNLKDLALAKIEKGIREVSYNIDEPETKVFVRLFERAFEDLPEREVADPLLRLLAKYAAWALETLREDKCFINLFMGNDRTDFIALILGNLRKGSIPWS